MDAGAPGALAVMAGETAADDGNNSDDTDGDSSGGGNRDDDAVATSHFVHHFVIVQFIYRKTAPNLSTHPNPTKPSIAAFDVRR
jgi:hypothetical protein